MAARGKCPWEKVQGGRAVSDRRPAGWVTGDPRDVWNQAWLAVEVICMRQAATRIKGFLVFWQRAPRRLPRSRAAALPASAFDFWAPSRPHKWFYAARREANALCLTAVFFTGHAISQLAVRTPTKSTCKSEHIGVAMGCTGCMDTPRARKIYWRNLKAWIASALPRQSKKSILMKCLLGGESWRVGVCGE